MADPCEYPEWTENTTTKNFSLVKSKLIGLDLATEKKDKNRDADESHSDTYST